MNCATANAALAGAACFSCLSQGQLSAAITSLLCQIAYNNEATVACDLNTLMEEAKCFDCGLTQGEMLAIQTYLLSLLAGQSQDVSTLMAGAKCFTCVEPKQLMAIQAYLLCTQVS